MVRVVNALDIIIIIIINIITLPQIVKWIPPTTICYHVGLVAR